MRDDAPRPSPLALALRDTLIVLGGLLLLYLVVFRHVWGVWPYWA